MSLPSLRAPSLARRIMYGDTDVPLSRDALIAAPIAAGVLLFLVGVAWLVWRRCVSRQKPPARFQPRAPVYRPPEGRDMDPDLPPYSPNELPMYVRAEEEGTVHPDHAGSDELPPEEGVELQDMRRPTGPQTSGTLEPTDAESPPARSSSTDVTASTPLEETFTRRPDRAHIA